MSFRSSSRFALYCVSAVILAVSLASCTSDLLKPVTHTWSLQTVRDAALPDTIPNSSPVIVISSGQLITDGSGAYTLTLSGTSDGTQGVVATDHGDWTITSSTFFFRSKAGAPDYIGGLNSGTVRVALAGSIVHSSNATIDMVFQIAE